MLPDNKKLFVGSVYAISSIPEADSLETAFVSLENTPTDYQVVVRKGDWNAGDLCIFVGKDYIVDSSLPELSWLLGKERIKPTKLRGTVSHGILVKPREGLAYGDDASYVAISYYAPETLTPGPRNAVNDTRFQFEASPPPLAYHSVKEVYDIENIKKHKSMFCPAELVVLTEKIHGTHVRACISVTDGKPELHVGSRNHWIKEPKEGEPKSLYWEAILNDLSIVNWLVSYPGYTIYGEIYGHVQKGYNYGISSKHHNRVVVFDIRDSSGHWLDLGDFLCCTSTIPTVPILLQGMYSDVISLFDKATSLRSYMPGTGHNMEGWVVKPIINRRDRNGRVILKHHNEDFLLRKKGTDETDREIKQMARQLEQEGEEIKISMNGYSVIIEKAEGNYSAYSPDLPGCVATGETLNFVINSMGQAIVFHLEGLEGDK